MFIYQVRGSTRCFIFQYLYFDFRLIYQNASGHIQILINLVHITSSTAFRTYSQPALFRSNIFTCISAAPPQWQVTPTHVPPEGYLDGTHRAGAKPPVWMAAGLLGSSSQRSQRE